MPLKRLSTPKRSAFRDLISAVRKHWRTALPSVRQVDEPLDALMSKASTFYAGWSPKLGLNVFINFQHSTKAWQVGQFTINLVLSQTMGAPKHQGGPVVPENESGFTEGLYRIGSILGGKDKWWHLKDDETNLVTLAWRPKSYAAYEAILAEAVADVTRDVRLALEKLGVITGGPAGA
jgi:hypothetical protein